MRKYFALALLGVFVLPPTAQAQNKFVYDARLTPDGVKDLQKRGAIALRTNVFKVVESAGCKPEYWYFDPLTSVAYGGADCQTPSAAVSIVTAVNAAGFARLRWRALLTAEQMDDALSKGANVRAPQNQN